MLSKCFPASSCDVKTNVLEGPTPSVPATAHLWPCLTLGRVVICHDGSLLSLVCMCRCHWNKHLGYLLYFLLGIRTHLVELAWDDGCAAVSTRLRWLLGTTWGHKPGSLAHFPAWALPNHYQFESVASKRKGFSYHKHQHPQPRVSLSSSAQRSCSLPASAAAPGRGVQHLRSSCCLLAASASSNLSVRRRRAMPAIPLPTCTINCQPSPWCL